MGQRLRKGHIALGPHRPLAHRRIRVGLGWKGAQPQVQPGFTRQLVLLAQPGSSKSRPQDQLQVSRRATSNTSLAQPSHGFQLDGQGSDIMKHSGITVHSKSASLECNFLLVFIWRL